MLHNRGFLVRLFLGGPQKHGDPWGNGKRDPRPFLEAQWEALLLLHGKLKTLGFWESELCEGWRDDATRLAHASEERLTSRVLFDLHRSAVREGRRHQRVAVTREQTRAARFKHLLETSMEEVVETLEEEVFTEELWTATHEVSRQWNIWSAAVAEQLLDDTVDWCVETAAEKHVNSELTEEWSELCCDLVVDALLDEQVHREIGSKVLIEAAIAHGLRVESKTTRPRPANAKSLILAVKSPADADFVAFTAAANTIQGLWHRRKARGMLRKVLASVWRKRWDDQTQAYYYENTLNGEMLWEAPRAFSMFFPEANW
jgi:hypothetical protein